MKSLVCYLSFCISKWLQKLCQSPYYSVGESLCKKIFNSNILSSNLNTKLLGHSVSTQSMNETCVWLPYTKVEGAGYKNMYTNAQYNHTALQTILGMSSLNFKISSGDRLAWYHSLGSDPSVQEIDSNALCQTFCDTGSIVVAKPVRIRGLCEKSTIQTDYYPMKNGWTGQGEERFMVLEGRSDDKGLATLVNLEFKTIAYVNDSETTRFKGTVYFSLDIKTRITIIIDYYHPYPSDIICQALSA